MEGMIFLWQDYFASAGPVRRSVNKLNFRGHGNIFQLLHPFSSSVNNTPRVFSNHHVYVIIVDENASTACRSNSARAGPDLPSLPKLKCIF